MKIEPMKVDSLEVSDDTPMYNPQGLPVKYPSLIPPSLHFFKNVNNFFLLFSDENYFYHFKLCSKYVYTQRVRFHFHKYPFYKNSF